MEYHKKEDHESRLITRGGIRPQFIATSCIEQPTTMIGRLMAQPPCSSAGDAVRASRRKSEYIERARLSFCSSYPGRSPTFFKSSALLCFLFLSFAIRLLLHRRTVSFTTTT
ncbi:hypothetical protein PENSPDRAFT_294533 [Peniophora sp. CONT]|nr:hypothetical protein PENSPDRAFT_294533 [Peniophora sp. CONT]